MKRAFDPNDDSEIARLYEIGLSTATIAEKLGKGSYNAVRNSLIR